MSALNFNAAAVQPSTRHRVEVATGPDAFASYIRQQLGYAPDAGKIVPGKWIHFPISDKRGDSRGACMMFPDGEGGMYGRWDENSTGDWHSWQARQAATPEEKADFRQKVARAREEAERKREQERAECRKRSAELWDKAQPANRQHPYLQLKGVDAHGLRMLDNSLLVPVRDTAETLHGLQFIGPDGAKKFMPGTAVTGHFHVIGTMQDNTLLIAEGAGTCETLHKVTGHAVACAFNAGNLKPVAKALREMLPDTTLIICADDDHATEGNPGLTKAREAAEAVNGLLTVPTFPATRGPKDTDFNDLAKLAGPEAVKACFAGNQTATTKPAIFLSAKDLLSCAFNVSYLIGKTIERDTTGQLFGPSGSGKTFLALDMALAVATSGVTLNGQRAEGGLVLYLAGEGRGGLVRRVKAWQLCQGKSIDDLRLFHVSRQTVNFDGSDLDKVRAEAQELAELHGVPIALIVVDTLARHIEGDENSTRDMSNFIKSVDSCRAAFPGSVALIVHHTGHGEDTKKRSRGSSALKAAMDFEIQCDAGLVTFTKMKDGETPDPIEFKLVPVEIGTDDDGEPITSCIVEYGERSERHKAISFTANEKQAIRALVNASSGSVKVEEGGRYGALVGDWKQAYSEIRLQQDPKTRANTITVSFGRDAKSLVNKGAVVESDHARFLVSKDHQGEICAAISAGNLLKSDK